MVSIIVLNRNNKAIIAACLDSVIKYSCNFDYELIVVDNQSTDGSFEMLCAAYEGKIKLYRNNANGCASGRNIGLAHANGDFICFLDSDQRVVGENWLQSAMDILMNHAEIGAVGWTGGWLRKDGTVGPIVDYIPDIYGDMQSRCITKVTYLGTGGMLVRKEAVDRAEGFDESYDPAFFEDTDFSLRICRAGYKLCVSRGIKIGHTPHQTTKHLDFRTLFLANQQKFRKNWSGDNEKYLRYTLDCPRKILVLSYYNPFNGGGGQRPLAFILEAIKYNAEVAFVFESDSDMDKMKEFPLLNHPAFKLLQVNENGQYKPFNAQAKDFTSETYLLSEWKPDLVIAHVPVSGLFKIFKCCKELGILTVYDQMDKWDAFPNDIFGKSEKEYIKTADLCTTITTALAMENIKRYGISSLKLPNAVYNSFAKKVSLSYQEVQDRNKRQRKKILYAGALWADWFDWGLLEYTIRNCPDYDFVVIGGDIATPEENVQGNNGDVITICHSYPNVIFTGLLLHDELPEYYRDANVATIPFIANDITKPCSPIKYYEYVSAFLPVVSTQIDDLKGLPFVSIAEEGENLYERFVSLLRKAAEHEITKAEYDNICQFIKDESTWQCRYEILLTALMCLK